MDKLTITPSKIFKYGINIAKDGVNRSASKILAQKSVNMGKFAKFGQKYLIFHVKLMSNWKLNSL